MQGIMRNFLCDEKEDKKDKSEEENFIKKMLDARIIMVSEPITDKLAKAVTTQCILMQEADKEKPISVYVNSPGGEADSGFAMYDILRFITPPVYTICTGLCASAAVLVYLSAPAERRYSLPNSRFLLHQPSTSMMGTAADLEINANEIIKLRERYNAIVAHETNRELNQINNDADRDFWLNTVEAKEYGLVGKIIEKYSEIVY